MTIELVQGSTSLDLRSGGDGIRLMRDGWIRTAPRRNDDGTWPKSVFESLTVSVDAASHDLVASAVQAMDTLVRIAGDHALEALDENPVYLKTYLTNESVTYQSLVLNGGTEPTVDLYAPPLDPGNYLSSHIVAIERAPFWEPETDTSLTFSSVTSTGNITRLYAGNTTSINGDVPARISISRVDGIAGGGGPMSEFWIGFRTNRFHPANFNTDYFESFWAATDGTLSNNTASQADATAFAGSVARWTPAGGADNEMLTRSTISVTQVGNWNAQVSSNDTAQRSRNLVLLRARASSTRTYRVRIQSGFAGGDNWKTSSRVHVDSTNWYYYPMGTVDIPPLLHHPSWDQMIAQAAIRIQAEEGTSGAGTLDIDGLFMIPVAEGSIYFKGGNVTGANSYVEIAQDDQGNFSGLGFDSTTSEYGTIQVDPYNYALPVGDDVVFVFVAQRDDESDENDVADVRLDYALRWLNLRGAE